MCTLSKPLDTVSKHAAASRGLIINRRIHKCNMWILQRKEELPTVAGLDPTFAPLRLFLTTRYILLVPVISHLFSPHSHSKH